MSITSTRSTSLALFCKVVDNFGDIGICWRLSRQLREEHGIGVSLWVDDLESFHRICPEVDAHAEVQTVHDVMVRYWRDQESVFAVDDIADIVIEFFGCDIPPAYVAAMAQRNPRPAWLNLEGLSAEDWVEGCHALPSMHPRLPLTKYFFFPGFTARTGGLLREAALPELRRQFQSDPANALAFLSRLGVTPAEAAAFKISLFCYPHAPVGPLFDAWMRRADPVVCLVPEGVASEAVQTFLGSEPRAGEARSRGALTVRVLPFVPQPDYDRLLWACDVNFVRGEDSFVRAQWAGKPFIWHIYPQDKDLHHVKLRAFLQRYARDMESLHALSLCWNGDVQVPDWNGVWARFEADIPALRARAAVWEEQMLAQGDLASNLLRFAASLQPERKENGV